MILADSTPSATEVGIWVGCVFLLLSIVAVILKIIDLWRGLTNSNQSVTPAELSDKLDQFVTKADFNDFKRQMELFRSDLTRHNEQDIENFGDLREKMTRVLTLLEERFPVTVVKNKRKP